VIVVFSDGKERGDVGGVEVGILRSDLTVKMGVEVGCCRRIIPTTPVKIFW
jgi:hypothetical protein